MRKLITFILIIAAAAMAFTSCMSKEATALKEEYPQYFDIDASNGLDVVVWQMAKDSYNFGLLPHSEKRRKNTDEELMNLKPVSAGEMRIILSTYKIDTGKIDVVVWQNPFSSYIPEDLIGHGGDGPFLEMDYKNKIRRMLLI